MNIEQEIQLLRGYVQMGHTPGTGHTENTSFTTFLPTFMNHMRYDDVIKIVDEISQAALLGDLDTTQKYMLQFLKENNIISALHSVALIKEQRNE